MSLSLNKRVAVVTGSNKGIGFAIVKALCSKFDGDVVLTARDEARGLGAIRELEQLGLTPQFHQLDIDDSRSIAKFSAFLNSTYGRLDVLVNNGAIAFKNAAVEPFGEQAEVTNRINYTGTLNLCHALFPLLAKGARVVNISSNMGHLSHIPSRQLRDRFSDPQLNEASLNELVGEFVNAAKSGTHKAKGWPNSAYSVSKIAVTALTRIQQRVLNETRAGENILVNCVHPGSVDTDMSSHTGRLSPDEGAVAAVWAALLPPNCATPAGAYIWYTKEIIDWVNAPPHINFA